MRTELKHTMRVACPKCAPYGSTPHILAGMIYRKPITRNGQVVGVREHAVYACRRCRHVHDLQAEEIYK